MTAPKAPSGVQVFLQSETALDSVHKFQMHIERKGAAATITEAKSACDQDISWYETTTWLTNLPPRKSEYAQTTHFIFTRSLAPEESNWNRNRRQIDPGVCDRLKTPSLQNVPNTRLISADQSIALPSFSAFANDQGATITHDGDEVVDDVQCEIWTIHHSASFDRANSIWIATDDHLPRKYVEGERNDPITVVTYKAFDVALDIHLPRSSGGY